MKLHIVETKVEPFVIKVETYENHKGQRIEFRSPVSGLPPLTAVGFRTLGALQIDSGDGQTHLHQFWYALKVDPLASFEDRLAQAFSGLESAYEAAAKAEMQRLYAEQQSKILVPRR